MAVMQINDEINILLVEDDDIDAKAVERGLRKLKMANPIRRARNGLEALAILRGDDNKNLGRVKRPYIVLLDLNMPKMGGLEFLDSVRGDESLQDSVIFVLTTSGADEDRSAAYKKNIAGYIVKSDVTGGFSSVIDMLERYWEIVVLPT